MFRFVPDICSSNPCQHGRCNSTSSGYQCRCYNGFIGLNCQYNGEIVLYLYGCKSNL